MLAALIVLANLWTWDASATATGYEFCWSRDLGYWSQAFCVNVGADPAFDTTEFDPLWAVEKTGGTVLYFQARAYNDAGYDTGGPAYVPAPALWVCP